MLELWTTPETWISFATLAALEIVLGIDNIVFITILAAKLPRERQSTGRKTGLAFALLTRLMLLVGISWVMGLSEPLFTFFSKAFTGRSLILLGGGLFLIGKSTLEIYESLEVPEHHQAVKKSRAATSMLTLIIQIMLLDVVFSLDSVITAVGMVDHLSIMMAAMVAAVGVMLFFANPIGDFVTEHPSMKVLALAFLLLVGAMLVIEALDKHIDRGYIYFAMAFSIGVELVNMRIRRKHDPVRLHGDRPSNPGHETALE